MDAKFEVQLKIRKPVAEVFEAVVNPAKLTGYFLQTSSGPLAQGSTVTWKFAEVDQTYDVVVGQVVKDERIAFDWPSDAPGGGPPMWRWSSRSWMPTTPWSRSARAAGPRRRPAARPRTATPEAGCT
uniref:ATPase n=1 Tax=Phenylobacterium glaciei TaxID=2803784 RepID=A0A974P0X9_9CAUL|nr:hypothetical protein JKL49_14130 [Phenylobacterium glaciei]